MCNIEITDCGATEFLAIKWEQIYNSEHAAIPDRNLNVREASCNSGRLDPTAISGNSITELHDNQFWEKMSFTLLVTLH
jgi:hypothetical protein